MIGKTIIGLGIAKITNRKDLPKYFTKLNYGGD